MRGFYTKHIKNCAQRGMMIDKGKGGKTLDKVKPVENVNNNTQRVLKIRCVEKENPPSYKFHAYD